MLIPLKIKNKIYKVIFESETRAGKIFDIFLMILILLSTFLVMLESVERYMIQYAELFFVLNVIISVLFAAEYILRCLSVPKPLAYITSIYGIIDLVSFIPFLLEILFPQLRFLSVIRILRLLRIFRVFKMVRFLEESNGMLLSLWESRRKIFIFLFFVLLLTVIFGSMMYVIENGTNEKFTSIPTSIYWAIVTLTTVGYGDISPITALGKTVASVIMILGYAIIAVPTGIITARFINASRAESGRTCKNCFKQGHDSDANFCKYCGTRF
ncbi:MAG: ion transporter [Bacteroidota bacterium]